MGSLPRPARREPTLRFAAGSPGADDAHRPADCKRWASKAANMLAETNGVSLADVSTSKGPKVTKADVEKFLAQKELNKPVANETDSAAEGPSRARASDVDEDEEHDTAEASSEQQHQSHSNSQQAQNSTGEDAQELQMEEGRKESPKSEGQAEVRAQEAGEEAEGEVQSQAGQEEKAGEEADAKGNQAESEQQSEKTQSEKRKEKKVYVDVDGNSYPLAGVDEMNGIPCPIEGNAYRGTIVRVTSQQVVIDIGFSKDAHAQFQYVSDEDTDVVRRAIRKGDRVTVLVTDVEQHKYYVSLKKLNPKLDEKIAKEAQNPNPGPVPESDSEEFKVYLGGNNRKVDRRPPPPIDRGFSRRPNRFLRGDERQFAGGPGLERPPYHQSGYPPPSHHYGSAPPRWGGPGGHRGYGDGRYESGNRPRFLGGDPYYRHQQNQYGGAAQYDGRDGMQYGGARDGSHWNNRQPYHPEPGRGYAPRGYGVDARNYGGPPPPPGGNYPPPQNDGNYGMMPQEYDRRRW